MGYFSSRAKLDDDDDDNDDDHLDGRLQIWMLVPYYEQILVSYFTCTTHP